MPLHQTAEHDPITSMIEIKTSAVFEMLVSLQGIIDSWKMQKLSEEARSALGEQFMETTAGIYRKFFACCFFTELAVDFPDRDDVEGFVDYVAALSAREFAFYVLGRWFPLEDIPESPNATSIGRLIETHEERDTIAQLYPDLAWADSIIEIQQSLCQQWGIYWKDFYADYAAAHGMRWAKSIDEKQDLLERSGGAALLRQITGHDELPPPVPPHIPITRVELIPLCCTPRRTYVFYGYGSAQILYDCSRTVEHDREVDDHKRRSLPVLKALADENRLKILKTISQNERIINGKKIAEKVKLSPSVVSRHLSQLKDAGLIEEHSADNRNITYSFQISRLKSLGEDIEAFIRD
jgi:DNA-binding transcriptional ArsR family regulator